MPTTMPTTQTPNRLRLAAILALLCCLSTAQAQALYKWVDARGNVSYSDTPPPSMGVKDLSNTLNVMGAGAAQAQTLGYETAQQAAKAPIVLYTSKGCTLCDTGRALLVSKQWPFSEKTINNPAQIKALNTKFATQNVPVLAVGEAAIRGFGASQWEEALAAAGYTAKHAVPAGYSNGMAEPLGGATAPEAANLATAPRKAGTASPSTPIKPVNQLP